LEIEPFSVKIAQIVTGAVKSNGQTYFENWKLPEDSLYRYIEALIAHRVHGGDGHPREETGKYAKDVVDDILSGKTGKVWRGGDTISTKGAMTSDVSQSLLVSP
jgi:1-acylglycerone phosphate reductase